MRYLTDTWPEATAFFHGVIGLHDSTIDGLRAVPGWSQCTLVLSEVYRHSDELGFQMAYKSLLVEMLGVATLPPKQTDELIGYDIVDAELLPRSLWINTLAGNTSFRFESIRFALPDAEE